MPKALFLLSLLVALALSLCLSLLTGSVPVTVSEIGAALLGQQQGLAEAVILELRLPRALSAIATGGLLALAGALMQVLLRNPLADPYVLGISGGAAVATLCAMLIGLSGLLLSGSAFIGALLAMLLVFGLARGEGGWSPTRLLLTGVVLAAGWSAIISFILAISPDRTLRGMLFWLMGDLSDAPRPLPGLLVLAIGLALSWPMARSLNVLRQGELQAGALGVNVLQLRLLIYLVASLLTATAVTLAGSIGFVGLVVPHMIRLLGFSDYRILLPAAALSGGILLLLADTLARSLIPAQQLPVGVITAALGVPLFLYLLHRGRMHKL